MKISDELSAVNVFHAGMKKVHKWALRFHYSFEKYRICLTDCSFFDQAFCLNHYNFAFSTQPVHMTLKTFAELFRLSLQTKPLIFT